MSAQELEKVEVQCFTEMTELSETQRTKKHGKEVEVFFVVSRVNSRLKREVQTRQEENYV
jgi:hypothetical protein